ncbi:MAG: hypothetical protein J0M08_06785 [Bacteroidetes bacterium]|nr:hypothetical protein [Bacteroidota bacterium]
METTDFLKTIKTMKNIVVITIALAFITCLVFAGLYIKATSENGEKIYVVSDAGTFLAKRNELGMRYDFEIKNHVRLFMQDLLEGDQYTYTQNMNQALSLIDNENGKRIYDQMQRGGFYDLYKRENAHTKVTFDSIRVDMSARPYKVKAYLKQGIYWAGYSKDIPYGAIMEIVEDSRSEKNPFGLLITNFNFIEYAVSSSIRTPQDSIN